MKRHQCKTFREFNKIIRKYWRREFKRHRGMWRPWLSFLIYTQSQINEVKRSKHYKNSKNLPSILKDFEEHKNQEVFFEGPREVGIFRGIEITNEDYYYVYEKDGDLKYDTCVDRINFLN